MEAANKWNVNIFTRIETVIQTENAVKERAQINRIKANERNGLCF